MNNEPGYPLQHIDAVITHTIRFLRLLAFHLGVKLLFEISWSGKFGVGQPWIGACRGTESDSWAKFAFFIRMFILCTHIFACRWIRKHPFHLSASSVDLTFPVSPSAPLPTSKSYIIPSEAA